MTKDQKGRPDNKPAQEVSIDRVIALVKEDLEHTQNKFLYLVELVNELEQIRLRLKDEKNKPAPGDKPNNKPEPQAPVQPEGEAPVEEEGWHDQGYHHKPGEIHVTKQDLIQNDNIGGIGNE